MTTSLPFRRRDRNGPYPTRRRALPRRPRGLSPRRPRRRGRRPAREQNAEGPREMFSTCVAGVIQESRKRSRCSFATGGGGAGRRAVRRSPWSPGGCCGRWRRAPSREPRGRASGSRRRRRRSGSSPFRAFRTRAPSGGGAVRSHPFASRARSPRPHAASPAGPRARAAREGPRGRRGSVFPSHVVDHGRATPRRAPTPLRSPQGPACRGAGGRPASARTRRVARLHGHGSGPPFQPSGHRTNSQRPGGDREEEEEHPPTGDRIPSTGRPSHHRSGRTPASTFNARSRKDRPGTD